MPVCVPSLVPLFFLMGQLHHVLGLQLKGHSEMPRDPIHGLVSWETYPQNVIPETVCFLVINGFIAKSSPSSPASIFSLHSIILPACKDTAASK